MNNFILKMTKIFKNQFVFSFITKIILVILGMISSILINRYLGPTLKGEYSYTLNIFNILVLVLNFGLYQYYPKLKRQNESSNIRSRFTNVVLFQFFIYFLMAIIIGMFTTGKFWHSMLYTLVPIMILAKQLNFILLVENPNKKNFLSITNEFFYIVLLLFEKPFF